MHTLSKQSVTYIYNSLYILVYTRKLLLHTGGLLMVLWCIYWLYQIWSFNRTEILDFCCLVHTPQPSHHWEQDSSAAAFMFSQITHPPEVIKMYFKIFSVSGSESVAQHNVCGAVTPDPFHRGACSRNPNQGAGALEPTMAGSALHR